MIRAGQLFMTRSRKMISGGRNGGIEREERFIMNIISELLPTLPRVDLMPSMTSNYSKL